MPIELSEDREYNRLKHTADESAYLRIKGFVPVVSSNVSAVARDEDKLIIRFHGGATYVYPNSGDKFDSMMSAYSKGKFVWRELVKKNVSYYRAGSYNIPDDVDDRDMMRPKAETKVSVDTVVTEKARANVVSVKQAEAQETIIDIRDVKQSMARQRPRMGNAALLSTMIDSDLTMGIIAGLLLAEMINENAEEADKK